MGGPARGLSERFRSAMFLLLFTCLIAASGWLWRWDQVLYDLQLSFMYTEPTEDILIVAVDEKSLEKLGRWPWSRSVHARLVERLSLAGAKAIVLDLLFAEADQSDPEGDIQLIHAVAASDRVFMPVILEQHRQGGMLVETMPLPDMANVATALGHVHMDLDADGIARGVYLYEGLGEDYWPHLMLSLYQWLQPESAANIEAPVASSMANVNLINRRNHLLIPFTGPAGNYPRLSYSDVLEGVYPQELFRDRIVLVGVTATGLGDSLPTPVSGYGIPMPGVEINANIFDSLRRGTSIEAVDFLTHMILSGLIVVIPFFLYAHFPTRVAPLVALSSLVLFILGNWIVFRGGHVWFPPSATLLGLLLSYPFWSWRRLDQAVRYLSDQLERMQEEQKRLAAQMPQSDLLDAIKFLSELMPLKGWVVHNARGRLLMHGGEPMNEPIDNLVSGKWQRAGAELWTRIPRQETDWQLGMVWERTRVPQGQSLALLDDFAQHFTVEAEQEYDSVLERVELRMHKMQQVNVTLQRFRHLINNAVGQMDDGLVVFNTLGQIVIANPRAAFYLGMDEDRDLVGEQAFELLQTLEIRGPCQWPEVFRQVLLQAEPIRFEALRTPDTELFVQVKSLDDADVGLRGVVVNLSYIGTIKRSERTRVKMLNFLSHDLRSPITSLLSLTQSKKIDEWSAGELSEQIQPLARRSLKLADNFLQLARAEAADTTNFTDTDFISVAHNAMDEAYIQAKEAGITLRREFDEDEIWLQGDLGLLERALFNLIENAIKFSPSDSEIVMQIQRQQGHLLCTIRDQGPGIPNDQLVSVFQPFTQAETENTSQGKGVGLGLSFVKVVADKHRGSIEATNHPSGGAMFTLRLPCESDQPA